MLLSISEKENMFDSYKNIHLVGSKPEAAEFQYPNL